MEKMGRCVFFAALFLSLLVFCVHVDSLLFASDESAASSGLLAGAGVQGEPPPKKSWLSLLKGALTGAGVQPQPEVQTQPQIPSDMSGDFSASGDPGQMQTSVITHGDGQMKTSVMTYSSGPMQPSVITTGQAASSATDMNRAVALAEQMNVLIRRVDTMHVYLNKRDELMSKHDEIEEAQITSGSRIQDYAQRLGELSYANRKNPDPAMERQIADLRSAIQRESESSHNLKLAKEDLWKKIDEVSDVLDAMSSGDPQGYRKRHEEEIDRMMVQIGPLYDRFSELEKREFYQKLGYSPREIDELIAETQKAREEDGGELNRKELEKALEMMNSLPAIMGASITGTSVESFPPPQDTAPALPKIVAASTNKKKESRDDFASASQKNRASMIPAAETCDEVIKHFDQECAKCRGEASQKYCQKHNYSGCALDVGGCFTPYLPRHVFSGKACSDVRTMNCLKGAYGGYVGCINGCNAEAIASGAGNLSKCVQACGQAIKGRIEDCYGQTEK